MAAKNTTSKKSAHKSKIGSESASKKSKASGSKGQKAAKKKVTKKGSPGLIERAEKAVINAVNAVLPSTKNKKSK